MNKKKLLDYAFKNEKLIQWKKDFSFWNMKTGKVFTTHKCCHAELSSQESATQNCSKKVCSDVLEAF